jgi:UDP-N-acetylmuramate--alanine ligase
MDMKKQGRIHFAGVAGSGMSALAQLLAWEGRAVSGSDRSFDRGGNPSARAALEEAGVVLFPQDGSGAAGAAEVVASAAVEADVPDLIRARALKIPLKPRWEILAGLANRRRSLAVAGTNGKSTTAALLAWILLKNGFDPSLALGASLRSGVSGLGNARRGQTDWLVFEADESDGGLVRYRPELGVITNISLDHFDLPRLHGIFSSFAGNCRRFLVRNADCPISRKAIPARSGQFSFSLCGAGDFQAESLVLDSAGSRFRLRGADFVLPLPGAHNAANALAAAAAAAVLGLEPARSAAALRDFPGLRRRLETVYDSSVLVLDDFAHNPAKVRSSLAAARLRGKRLIALYQPHGFGPLRLTLGELAAAFVSGLGPGGRLCLLPVHYAGGTARRDVSSADLAAEVSRRGGDASLTDREEAVFRLAADAREGDVILVMGARDETLSELARGIGEAVKNKGY